MSCDPEEIVVLCDPPEEGSEGDAEVDVELQRRAVQHFKTAFRARCRKVAANEMYHRLRRKCKYNPREYKSRRAYDRVMNQKGTIYRRKLIATGKLSDTLKMNAAERLFALLPGYLQWAKIRVLEDWRERNRKAKDRLYQLQKRRREFVERALRSRDTDRLIICFLKRPLVLQKIFAEGEDFRPAIKFLLGQRITNYVVRLVEVLRESSTFQTRAEEFLQKGRRMPSFVPTFEAVHRDSPFVDARHPRLPLMYRKQLNRLMSSKKVVEAMVCAVRCKWNYPKIFPPSMTE
ncbi:hypothetical protein PPYR_01446 [Photinus pyralis]|uniref:Uncharacterized protein n=2 Tax=Photinus pyralis TaxID=7054 RepID=A0A5N4B4H9_PHOPY|nr:uncharacterized protein LOC116175704 isoform X1 [Photinus pyralis]XP_031349839.1 uncharacterized protein LOC116175704 isoform X1 [Photinus pyralis]XP_031358739.1 uncharacterized protein LOC116182350 [Photinus pyralis]XP_031358888.1 uncharacterized protein LOC116182495 [Photinus pyralis]XP_031359470.1 uncharacterized protein LOC116183015 isoform X2 [Photinus pyralis]KAB0804476.1 hypothetical protein PPYR_01446 [Photinus pyralis]